VFADRDYNRIDLSDRNRDSGDRVGDGR